MSDTQKIVVRVLGNHPTGTRRRAGFVFGKLPTRVEVNAEELKMIQEDNYLIIVTKGTGLEQATDQKKTVTAPEATTSKEKTIDDFSKKEIIAELEKFKVTTTGRENKEVLRSMLVPFLTAPEATDGADSNEDLAELSVEEIIARLEAKGLVEGTDFVKDADKEALIELLLA